MAPAPATRTNMHFFEFCGVLGLFGCVASVATDIAGVIVSPTKGFVHDTISSLAAGPFDWIQDIGLSWLALGMIAVGCALYRWHLGGWAWKLGSGLLTALAVTMLLITVREKYAKLVPHGLVIHQSLVYTTGVVFAFISLLTAKGFNRVRPRWMYYGVTTAVLWILAAPILYIIPDRWEGIYERFVALLMVIWLAVASYLLIRSAMRSPAALASCRRPGRNPPQ
ncbi:MAG TPA: DUF998 domain-containing protein [Gammaproteobacteria bacterium]|nr:DUF998 domain-containing protein [Gammaproteobacteria bacterium]